jgi:hypothetical protein
MIETLLTLTLSLALGGQQPGPQDDPPPQEPPVKETDAPNTEKTEKAPPSLDELLGLDGDAAAEKVSEEKGKDELERRLNEEEIGSAFGEAIAQMGRAAAQLEEHFDTGLGTQRVQEDILKKLDDLLEAAKQQQQQQGSSSSSSSSPSPQPSPEPGKQGQRPQPGEQRNPSPNSSQEGDPPPMQQGDINTMIEEQRSEWGNLPQRVREMLLQGREEKFSSLYEQLTREYYRRLAEDGSP